MLQNSVYGSSVVCLHGPRPMRVGTDTGWLPRKELAHCLKLGPSSCPRASAQEGIVDDALGYRPSHEELFQVWPVLKPSTGILSLSCSQQCDGAISCRVFNYVLKLLFALWYGQTSLETVVSGHLQGTPSH